MFIKGKKGKKKTETKAMNDVLSDLFAWEARVVLFFCTSMVMNQSDDVLFLFVLCMCAYFLFAFHVI